MVMTRNTLLPLVTAFTLAACGGSSSTSSEPISGATTSARAVDGYLSGSTVFCDTNRNEINDADELSGMTDTSGNFTLLGACSAPITVVGGTDTATAYPFKGLLKAEAGSAYVTPLTTLLVGSGLTARQLAISLGLPADLDVTALDPMEQGNGALLKRTLAVQQLMQQLANVFGTLTGPDTAVTLYSKVANALAAAILAASNTAVLITDDGKMNTDLVSAAIHGAIQNINSDSNFPHVSLSDTDVADIVAALTQEAERFLQAADADLTSLAKELQSTVRPPIATGTAKQNYLSPKDNTFLVNGTPTTLSQFASGVNVTGLDTIGLEYSATGVPQIDTLVDVAMSLMEVSGNRALQVKVKQLHVTRDNTTGQVTLETTPASQVHIYASDSQGTSFNTSVSDPSFKPITIVANAITIHYQDLVNKIANNVRNTSPFNASQFASIRGTFQVKFAVSNNLNVRYSDGTPLPVTNIGVYNTIYGVEGPGITGQLTIN